MEVKCPVCGGRSEKTPVLAEMIFKKDKTSKVDVQVSMCHICNNIQLFVPKDWSFNESE